MLERAIADALPSSNLIGAKDGETSASISRSAWGWILASREGHEPSAWSFAWVCQHLEFDADSMARALIAMRDRGAMFYRERDARQKASQARRQSVA